MQHARQMPDFDWGSRESQVGGHQDGGHLKGRQRLETQVFGGIGV